MRRLVEGFLSVGRCMRWYCWWGEEGIGWILISVTQGGGCVGGVDSVRMHCGSVVSRGCDDERDCRLRNGCGAAAYNNGSSQGSCSRVMCLEQHGSHRKVKFVPCAVVCHDFASGVLGWV